jgi:uncharacterized LabA/DUF88 family protein
VNEERLKMAVFIDFDNIQIGVKETLTKDFDVSIVLEALKERGEVVSKTAYGDWPRAGDHSRQMTQHAVHMVQRNVTPRGDKNGADINLALDALEMAFTRDHINAFVIVGGDSDFMALVEKLKQYDKRVFVVGGRQFTSGILQRNCHEFIAYENLLRSSSGEGGRSSRSGRSGARPSGEGRSLTAALPNIERALKILAEREVAPQVGLLKSTLLQLDATFSERDFGATSFLEFIEKLEHAGLVRLKKTDRGYLVEPIENGVPEMDAVETPEPAPEPATMTPVAAPIESPESAAEPVSIEPAALAGPSNPVDAMAILRRALEQASEKSPGRPLYLRQVRQLMRAVDARYDERQGGFRGMLDLLHQAQREGLLRLHRDRKGTWRAFPVAPTAQAEAQDQPTTEPGMIPQPEPDEMDEALLAEIAADGVMEPEIPVEPEISLEEVMQEAPEGEAIEEERLEEVRQESKSAKEPAAPSAIAESERKPKRARGKSVPKPGTRRRTASRRKRKEEPPQGTSE